MVALAQSFPTLATLRLSSPGLPILQNNRRSQPKFCRQSAIQLHQLTAMVVLHPPISLPRTVKVGHEARHALRLLYPRPNT